MSRDECFHASGSEIQYAGQVLVERIVTGASSSEDSLQPLALELAERVWRQVAADLLQDRPLNPAISLAVSKALIKAIDDGGSLMAMLGLARERGRPPVALDKKAKVGMEVLALMLKGESYEEAIAQIALRDHRTESAVEKDYLHAGPLIYPAREIEFVLYPGSFSQKERERFERLNRIRSQRN